MDNGDIKMGESSKSATQARTLLGERATDGAKEGEAKASRKFPEEEEEELLRESTDRFVLFPIKYREVRPGYRPVSVSVS